MEWGSTLNIVDGKGGVRTYGYAGGGTRLKSILWPDGYKIEVGYQSWNVNTVTDNRGNRFNYHWSNTLVTNATVTLLESVDVERKTSAGLYSIVASINYEYQDNSYEITRPLLSKVLRNETGQPQEVLAEYTYPSSTSSFPVALETVSNALGLTKTFTYSTGTSSFPKLVSSESPNGLGSVSYDYSSGDKTVTNPLGKVTELTFDSNINGAVTVEQGIATPSCLASTLTRSYTPPTGSPKGFVYEQIERNGSKTTFTRETRGLVLTKVEDADGVDPRTTTYTWHADFRLPLTRTTNVLSETFSYDTDGQLTGHTQTDVLPGSPNNGQSRAWTYTYLTLASGLKVLQSVEGPGLVSGGISDITSYTYYADGSVATETDPNGLVTSYTTYNAFGLAERVVQPDGVAWALTYDELGQLTQAIENADFGSSNSSTLTYDVDGKITSYTNGRGHTWTFAYDGARRLVQVTDAAGQNIKYTHDAMGNVTRTEYENASAVVQYFEETTFDELGRLKKLVGANGQSTTFTHDVEDNLDTATDTLGYVTDNGYDALNRLTSVVDLSNSAQTTMAHNDADQVTQYTDPRSIATTFTYNGFGEAVQEVSADRGTISYTFDERGLVTSMTDGRGTLSNYTYGNGGRITSRIFPGASAQDQTFSYDGTANGSEGEGKIATINDEAGSIYRSFSGGGKLSLDRRDIEGVQYDVAYTFGVYGDLDAITTPGLLEISYARDTQGRVTQITAQRQVIDLQTGQYPPAQTVVSGIQYRSFGPVSSLTYGDTAVQTRSYDSSYRLISLQDQLGVTNLRNVSLGWSSRDNLASSTDNLNAANTELFQYSPRQRLSQADGPYGDLDFSYDLNGNRVTRSKLANSQLTTETYSYPSISNRLQSIVDGGSTRALSYDAAGNVTADNLDGSIYGYAYNAANRMESFSIGGVLEAEYVYNALGQQVVRRLIPSGQTIHVVHDADGKRLAEYDYDPVSQTSTLLREYIWLEGVPIAVVENDTLYYIRTDHIGRPVFATDATGTKVWEASYLPFGGVHVSTGANSELRFPGQWFQSESGLHQNWMRDYDPTTGRYLQADPLGLVDGPSVYGYALQNPGRYIDPRGEQVGVYDGTGGVSLPGDIPGAGSGTGGVAVGVGGRLISGVIAGIIYPSTMADGEARSSAPTSGWCGDPCQDLENKVNELKTRSKSLGSCKGGMSKNALRDRYNVWRKVVFKRQERDQICHGASDAGHSKAITDALNRMKKCRRLLGDAF